MIIAQLPANEDLRLKELYSLELLDTENEKDFDELVQLASYICNCEISLLSLIDKDRQWFKAKKGIIEKQTPRELSFCAHAILQKEVFVVEDTLNDIRFCDNPFVTQGHIRFYAGAPIDSENNLPLGTICVADTKPRKLTRKQLEALSGLARQASLLIELKNKNKLLKLFAIEQRALKEKAEKASRAEEVFLSTMSHEIRTPLNGVIGIIEVLSENSPRQDQMEDINFLKASSKHLLHIVNDILDFNKIESGNLFIEKIRFNLREVIYEIQKTHQPKLTQKGLQFKTIIDPQIPDELIGDPARIKQILNNLTDNAIKFTERGSVQIEAELTNTDNNKHSVVFKVRDTGIGIEASNVEQIFDRFSQLHSGSARTYGGTGLGLSIVKKILEVMNSQIQVETFKNIGSCFSFMLVFDNVKENSSAVALKPSNKEKEDKLRFLKVLVVEDNEMNRLVLEKFLNKWEAKADFAMNGLEAINKVLRKDYDIILMDLNMPEVDGYEATLYIRKELKKDMPIIATTADTFFKSFNTYGFTDYILKPLNRKDLYNKMLHYVGDKLIQ